MSQSANNKTISVARLTAISHISMEGIPDPAPLQFHTSARDAEGRLYLSDEFNHRIIILDQDGKCLKVIGSRGGEAGQFWYPRGLAIVDEGGSARLVVCDAWNHRIQVFDTDGTHLLSFGSIGEGEAHFNEPCVVLPEAGGNVWILDRCNHRIKLCSLDGRTLKIIGRRMTVRDEEKLNDPVSAFLPIGDEPSAVHGLYYPMSMARLDGGDFIIADTNNGRLVRMRPDGVASQIVNLKGETPPYLFPSWVGNAGGGFVMVRGFSGPFRLIDLTRPWMDAPIDTAADAFITAFFEERDTLTLIDARKGQIGRHALDKSGAPETPSVFAIDQTPNVSRSWADRNGSFWLSYLLSLPESENAGELSAQFIAMCRNEAVKAGNRLSETESAYLKSSVEYYALAERTKQERRETGAPSNEIRSALNWQTVNIRQIEGERNEFRRILIQNLSWALNLIGAKSVGFVDKYLAGETGALRKILEDELKARVEDYHRVEAWLMESADKPNSFNPAASFNAILGILFLFEHARYLKRALKTLGSPLWKEAPEGLPWAVFVWKGKDIAVLVNQLFVARGFFCRQAGRYDSAIEAFKNGMACDIQSKRYYEAQIGVTMLLAGDVDAAAAQFGSTASSASSETQVLVTMGSILANYGRDTEALDIFRKAIENVKPANPLYTAARRGEVYALKNIGGIDEALKIIGEMEKTSPADPSIHIWRGDVSLTALKSREAIESFRKADECGAGPSAALRAADAHLLRGEHDDAKRIYESVIHNPISGGIRNLYEKAKYGVARSLFIGGNSEEALKTLDSTEFLGNYPSAAMLRCDILRAMGRLDESTDGLKKLSKLYPETRGVGGWIALNLALAGEKENALDVLTVEARKFASPQTQRIKGMVLRICGQAMESAKALAEDPHVSALSTLISMERYVSASLTGEEREISAAMSALKEIAGKADAWHGFIYAREEQGDAIEKTFTFAEEGLKSAGKVLRHERRSPITWSYAVK